MMIISHAKMCPSRYVPKSTFFSSAISAIPQSLSYHYNISVSLRKVSHNPPTLAFRIILIKANAKVFLSFRCAFMSSMMLKAQGIYGWRKMCGSSK
jgi:hypothetical protein